MSDTSQGNVVIRYFQDSYAEFRKVTWPTRKQSLQLFFLVISISILVTGLITILDYLFAQGYQKLIGA